VFLRRLLQASLQACGRRARSHAAISNVLARYEAAPPLRLISRLIVDGARLSRLAIERRDAPMLSPREVSSRFDKVSAWRDCLRAGGRIPPARDKSGWIEEESLSNNRPMELMLSPRCYLSQISAFSLSVKYIRGRLAIMSLHL